MMKHKNTNDKSLRHFKPSVLQVFFGTCIMLGCSSCVPTIEHSLIEDGKTVEVPQLVGTWKSVRQDEVFDKKPEEIFWKFEITDEGHTLVNASYYNPNYEMRNHLTATVSITKLKDGKLYAEYEGFLRIMNTNGAMGSAIPLHSVALIKIIDDGIEITPLNLTNNILKELLIKEKVSFKDSKGGLHINCSGNDLRNFVTKYSSQLFHNKENLYKLRRIYTKPEIE